MFSPRARRVKILATLGPASASVEMIRALIVVGADAFRINMSHGTPDARGSLIANIRALESEIGRPLTILADLQGPKLRIGSFASGKVTIERGDTFTLDLDPAPGDATRVQLPHKELFTALAADARLLVDDGKIVLRCTHVAPGRITTTVVTGGTLSTTRESTSPTSSSPSPR
jgi:pyruvate kinase